MAYLALLSTHAPLSVGLYSRASKTSRRTVVSVKAKINGEIDPLFLSAINAATLRFQETHRSEPLIIDPYVGCFTPPARKMEIKRHTHHYVLATKIIDDKLLQAVSNMDDLRQVVLLTDGMDTRPYRLNWPRYTVIYEISPGRVFRRATKMLEDVGAKISRNCSLLHIPLESSDIQQTLCAKGFSGNQQSIWAIQGLPVMTLASFENIMAVVSSLAMKGCYFLGEMPAWLADTDIGTKSSGSEWMDKLFTSHGFRVNMINYDEAATRLRRKLDSVEYKNILFLAEHLRFSDDQMETWRKEFQRVEEEGDEEGFEEL